ncbi:MAG: hypothetical protein RL393_781 [Actinomycetota bacterium]|jgi:hypothetical protein|nr:hypothetical protein [Actinomycetota bacterium]
MQKRSLRILALSIALLLSALPNSPTASAAKKKPIPATSPKPVWPPKGFKEIDGVFAKVPSSEELIGLLSAKRSLQKFLEQCEEFACGAVFVAAERGCTWWEVNSTLRKVNASTLTKDRIGTLVTYAKGTDSREQGTIFLVSEEPVDLSVSVGNIRVICHREKTNIPKPGNVYNKISAGDK